MVERYSNILNCKILSFAFVYLVIPIGANPRKMEIWEPIISKFKKELASWKHRNLSFVGRICLINLVVSYFPLFHMSFFQNFKRSYKIFDRFTKRFLWGCWVSWKKICSPKAHGGVRG